MQCKICKFEHPAQEVLLKHYRLRHYRGRNCQLPCLYTDCICSFKTTGALKSHLSRSHKRLSSLESHLTYNCEVCDFKEICKTPEIVETTSFIVLEPRDLNDHYPLTAYRVGGKMLIALKSFLEMLLRVILAPDNIRRLQISENLESVDQLKQILKEKLQLQNGFEIQFEDPEFQNELCNLNDITELPPPPPNKAVLKILFNNRNEELPSTSSQDNASVSPVPPPATSSTLLMQREIAERWPTPFPIPAFSYDVELRLVKGNEVYEKSKMLLNVSRDTTDIVVHRKSTALHGLPLLLKEKADHLLRTCKDTDPEETCTNGLKVGVLTIVEDDVATVNSNPTIRTMAVVVEEQIVLDEVEDLPNAFALLFGLIYALNIEYPKEVTYTFEVIQKLFMQLGSQCSPKVLNLKNKLLGLDV